MGIFTSSFFFGVRLPNAPKNKTKMAARKLYFRRLRSCVRDWIGYENHTASKGTQQLSEVSYFYSMFEGSVPVRTGESNGFRLILLGRALQRTININKFSKYVTK